MSVLEIRPVPKGSVSGRLCESCRLEQGPARSARFRVFLLGRPADECCSLHKAAWEALFARDEEMAA